MSAQHSTEAGRHPALSPLNLIFAAPNMLAALHKARACILLDRTTLADCHTGPDGLDACGVEGVAKYDETLAVINAAIAEAEGQQ